MSYYKDHAHSDNPDSELSLEPMEIKEEPVSDDSSLRDRRQYVDVAANSADQVKAGARPRKPAGKANFLRDDRKNSERRSTDRRKSFRLTGDRRITLERRQAPGA